MDQFAKLNRQGLTLVEVMIALMVMLLVFFALMQTALVGIDANMLNTLRSEAVNVAEVRMNEVRTVPFASIVTDAGSLTGCDCPSSAVFPPTTGQCVQRDVRSIEEFKFCSNVTCTELGGDNSCATDDADNRRIDVMVGWKWKGQNYVHRITTVRKR
jgi:type II secretory pathway pseudopilin PulG